MREKILNIIENNSPELAADEILELFKEEKTCGHRNCDRPSLNGNVYCQYHYDINFG